MPLQLFLHAMSLSMQLDKNPGLVCNAVEQCLLTRCVVPAHLRQQAESTKLNIGGEEFKLLIARSRALQHHRTLSKLHAYFWKTHARCRIILLSKFDTVQVCFLV